ncbi:MAG: type II toxin-antitoxin system HicA family toxin [Gloeomargaritaceae cyanobacterium C42_A2020_066]|nr:type II toxin-antitoxin system HicA family toxin [Gloeomargaritaceae cyanobacterium C42_A2020_066]
MAGVGSETLITLLKRHFGWAFAPQTGSHLILTKTLSLSVPRRRDLPQGTLASVLQQAGISREEFLKVLR